MTETTTTPPPVDLQHTIAEQIRRRRRAIAWTQRDLARRADVPENKISIYENGRQMPDLETIVCIAIALETTVDALITPRLDETA